MLLKSPAKINLTLKVNKKLKTDLHEYPILLLSNQFI